MKMKELFKNFYLKVGGSPLYWGPLLLFSIVSYSFSIYNRTVHWDDLLKETYNETMLSNRWGMILWAKIVGVMDLVPFTDRFVTVLFLLIASVLISVLFFYLKNQQVSILPYTVLSSMVLTFPLINEIFEFTGADLQYAGNLALVLLTLIYLLNNESNRPVYKYVLVSSLLLVLPASSYEVGLFSYVTLVCAVFFFQYSVLENDFTFKEWIRRNVYIFLPLIIAVAVRFVIAFFLRTIYDLPFSQGGSTGIDYEETSLAYLIGSNGFRFYFAGLIYFPISIFVFTSVAYVIYVVMIALNGRKKVTIPLAVLLYVSIFLLTIIQGCCMQYRTAQTVTVFVAFVSFLLCSVRHKYQTLLSCLLLFLCWHQSVFLNKVLSLNNMRSNNEAAAIRYVGYRLTSEFDANKPVVLLTSEDYYGGYLGPWISKRVYADENTWNGHLFTSISKKYLPAKYHHYKMENSNIINAIGLGGTQKKTFEYYGFDVNIQSFSSVMDSVQDSKRKVELERLFNDLSQTLPPKGIKDVGECIFVNLIQ